MYSRLGVVFFLGALAPSAARAQQPPSGTFTASAAAPAGSTGAGVAKRAGSPQAPATAAAPAATTPPAPGAPAPATTAAPAATTPAAPGAPASPAAPNAVAPSVPGAGAPNAAAPSVEGADDRLSRLELDVQLLKRTAADDVQARERLARIEADLAALRAERGRAATPATPAAGVLPAPAPGTVPVASPAQGEAGVSGADAFTIASRDGRFLLRTTALLQPRYTGVKRQGQELLTESGLALRRARVGWAGHVFTPRLGYFVQLEMGEGRLRALDLYAEAAVSSHWSVRVGQARLPSSRSWLTDERRLAFPERSVATEEFRYDYDIGLLATGTWFDRRLEASFGGFNGAGGNVAGNDNIDPVLVMRLSGTPLGEPWTPREGDPERSASPALTLGASATLDYVPVPNAYGFTSGSPLSARAITNRDTNGDGRPDGVRVLQISGELAARWRGLAVETEVYLRRESWGDIGALQPTMSLRFIPHTGFAGGFFQLSYFVLPRALQVGARVARTEVSPLVIGGKHRPSETCVGVDGQPFACTLPYSSTRSELTLLIAAHRFGGGASLAGMYSLLAWSTPEGTALPQAREQRFMVQAQLAF